MKSTKELVLLYKDLFCEESFLNGLEDLDLSVFGKENDFSFQEKLENHLLFYKENLYNLPFERIKKAGNIIFYHLQKENELDQRFLEKLHEFLNIPQSAAFSLNESIAKDFLKPVLKNYSDFDKKNNEILARASKEIVGRDAANIFKNPIENFKIWQASIYGLGILDKKTLLSEARIVQKEIDNSVEFSDFYYDLELFIKFFIDYFKNSLKEDLGNTKVIDTPDYLKSLEPTAAAYTFDQLKARPCSIVFVNFKKSISIGRLMPILFHEIFGHALHYRLIAKYCKSKLKTIPFLCASPLIEGFALLSEDFIVEEFGKKKVQEDFEKALGESFSGNGTFLVLKNFYLQSRLLRYLRYVFEIEIYTEGKSPQESIEELSRDFEFDKESLKEDLFSFLTNPGYASCYIGGYKILKNLGDYKNSDFRKDLAKNGFAFTETL